MIRLYPQKSELTYSIAANPPSSIVANHSQFSEQIIDHKFPIDRALVN